MTFRPQHRWLVPWMALCLACAPTEGDPPDETDGGALDAGATDGGATDGGATDAGQPVGTTIGAAGGLVQFGNLVFVEIPAGALAADTELTIAPVEATAPDGLTKVTGGFRFGPDGTTFAEPVAVTMVLGQAAPADVKLYWSKAGGASGFDALPTQLVAAGGAIKASVSHFSIGFGAGTLAATGACSPQEQHARDALAGYTPLASETGTSARLLLLGSGTTRYLLAGGDDQLVGTGGAMYTLDGRRYEKVNPEILLRGGGSSSTTGVGVDVQNGWIYEMVSAGNDLTIIRRKAGACAETVGTIASAFPSGSGVLAVAANGDAFALAKLRDGRRVSFVGTNGGTTWTMKGEVPGHIAWYAPGSTTRIHVGGGNSGSLARLSTTTDGGATWTTSGVPSGTILTGTSYVRSLAFDPADAGTIYAATTLGLYKSTDGGLSFPLPAVQLPGDRKPVQAAFASDGRLFVLAGAGPQNATGGLFVRAAGGTTFTAADGDLPAGERPGTALALKEEGGGLELVRISGFGRIWRSLDSGVTWTTGSAGLDGTRTFQVLTDPRNEQALYVGVQQIFSGATRLWHTIDGGATLTPTALPESPSHGSFAVLGDGTLFVLEQNTAQGQGLRSTDNGATFTNSAGLNSSDGGSNDMFGAAFTWTQSVFPDAAPTVAYYVNKVGSLWRTEDSAATWSALGPIAHATGGRVTLYVSPATPRRLVAEQQVGDFGTAQALKLSTNGGTSWTDLAVPAGLSLNPGEGGFDAAGHLWLPAYDPTTTEPKFLVLDPAATALVDRTTPGASFSLRILGHRVTAKDTRSTDGGLTWAALTQAERLADLPLADTGGAFVHRANPKRVIVQFSGLRTSLLP